MGINDEYSRDAFHYDLAYDSESSEEEYEIEVDPEQWEAIYSDELLDGWMFIREFCEEVYLQPRASFTDFIELVIEPWRWTTTERMTQMQDMVWRDISQIQVISQRVSPENFCAWMNHYIPRIN
jgi:hypothetical protein